MDFLSAQSRGIAIEIGEISEHGEHHHRIAESRRRYGFVREQVFFRSMLGRISLEAVSSPGLATSSINLYSGDLQDTDRYVTLRRRRPVQCRSAATGQVRVPIGEQKTVKMWETDQTIGASDDV